MSFQCLFCLKEGTDNDDLIKLHENINHHGHLSCLDTYYGYFRIIVCPYCSEDLDGSARNLFDFKLSLANASLLDRLDLFEKRLDQLDIGEYRCKSWSPHFLTFGKKWKLSKSRRQYKTSYDYYDYKCELEWGIMSTAKYNQARFLQLLLNHASKKNIILNLLSCYRYALEIRGLTGARMILEAVLKNQLEFAGNQLFEFLKIAIDYREMESAALILQKGIGIEFRKRAILKLGHMLDSINSETDWEFCESIGQWSPKELDYGLRYAAYDGYLKYCKFLISKGACIRRAGVGRILLKRCMEKDDRELLQHVSQYFEGIKVETARSKKDKWVERVKLYVYLKFFSLRLKLCHKPHGY